MTPKELNDSLSKLLTRQLGHEVKIKIHNIMQLVKQQTLITDSMKYRLCIGILQTLQKSYY